MARRRSRKSSAQDGSNAGARLLIALLKNLFGTRIGRYVLVGLNVLVLLAGGGWYLAQPAERKAEIRLLVGNYLEREKKVNLGDLAKDLWQYYYGDQFVDSTFRGGESQVYGGAPDTSALSFKVRLLQNEGYSVGYADALKNPVWVGYRLFDHADLKEPGERPEGFDTDDRTFSKVRSRDYTGSGYDRGHLAPNYAIARCYGKGAQEETFLMSNIIPQKHELNAGPWKQLEMKAAVNYPARYQEIWVITGPIFDERPKQTQGGVPIPVACYKIMIDETGGKLRTQAFIMPQDVVKGATPKGYLASIDEIEKRTGIDFLADLDDSVESQLEAKAAASVW